MKDDPIRCNVWGPMKENFCPQCWLDKNHTAERHRGVVGYPRARYEVFWKDGDTTLREINRIGW